MRIAIYPGSFNPIHSAHIGIANKLIEKNIADKVIFVPAGDGYSKKNLVEGKKRKKMIELAIENDSRLGVSDIEIINNKLYSYQTLDYFKSQYVNDDIILIIGSDNLRTFNSWKNYSYILKTYKLIVFLRDGDTKNDFAEYLTSSDIVFVDYNVDLSSTEIRKLINDMEYEKIIGKLNRKVFEYIEDNSLYKGFE